MPHGPAALAPSGLALLPAVTPPPFEAVGRCVSATTQTSRPAQSACSKRLEACASARCNCHRRPSSASPKYTSPCAPPPPPGLSAPHLSTVASCLLVSRFSAVIAVSLSRTLLASIRHHGCRRKVCGDANRPKRHAEAQAGAGRQGKFCGIANLSAHTQCQRNFGRLAMFGFASTLICSWEVILVSLGLSLGNGGTAGLFWTYLITIVGLIFVYVSLAELGSMIPTSGGQYFWVAVLAPPKYRNYLSYITGKTLQNFADELTCRRMAHDNLVADQYCWLVIHCGHHHSVAHTAQQL
jgi:Amino acid permease